MPAVPATAVAAVSGSKVRDNSMAYERLRNSGLTQALSDLFGDLGHLVQKEIQLAKAEITDKITSRLRASVWMVAAGFLGLIAALLVGEAAVSAAINPRKPAATIQTL